MLRRKPAGGFVDVEVAYTEFAGPMFAHLRADDARMELGVIAHYNQPVVAFVVPVHASLDVGEARHSPTILRHCLGWVRDQDDSGGMVPADPLEIHQGFADVVRHELVAWLEMLELVPRIDHQQPSALTLDHFYGAVEHAAQVDRLLAERVLCGRLNENLFTLEKVPARTVAPDALQLTAHALLVFGHEEERAHERLAILSVLCGNVRHHIENQRRLARTCHAGDHRELAGVDAPNLVKFPPSG